MLLHTVRIIFVLLEVLILFNLLIVVHELGHFLAAHWLGHYVIKVGIWFATPLWKKTIDGGRSWPGSRPFGARGGRTQLAPLVIIEGKAEVNRAGLPKFSAGD